MCLMMALSLSSCSSKQSPVDDLEELSVELEEESEDYSESDWENVAAKYAKIEEDLQKYEYTDEELKAIGKLKAKCLKSIAKSSAKNLKKQWHDIQMQMEGASDELQDAAKEFEKIFDE